VVVPVLEKLNAGLGDLNGHTLLVCPQGAIPDKHILFFFVVTLDDDLIERICYTGRKVREGFLDVAFGGGLALCPEEALELFFDFLGFLDVLRVYLAPGVYPSDKLVVEQLATGYPVGGSPGGFGNLAEALAACLSIFVGNA
jgi:hypothetical protein